MKFFFKRCRLLIYFLNFTAFVSGQDRNLQQIRYEPGDWVSYLNSRNVLSITVGEQSVYWGTTGGILRYDRYRHELGDPITTSDGLSSNYAHIVVYDNETHYLWVVTPISVSHYEPTPSEWRNTLLESIGIPYSGVIEIGFGGNSIFLWTSVGLFEGTRFSGHFQFKGGNKHDAQKVTQWYGGPGNPEVRPYNFPTYFLSDGFVFFEQGFVQDFQFRKYPITSYVVDNWGNIWFTTAGAGIAYGDVNTKRLEVLAYGPTVSWVEALLIDDSQFWVGGNEHVNSHQHGINRWDGENDTWQNFEGRYIPEIRDDNVTSIDANRTAVWFGTFNGVLRYDKRENSWKTFTVFDNLTDNYIYDVEIDDDRVWVATKSGISRILLPGMIVEKFMQKRFLHTQIYDVEADSQFVWFGTEVGIQRLDKRTNEWAFFDAFGNALGARTFPPHDIVSIDKNKREIWFATEFGVLSFDYKKQNWESLPLHSLIFENNVNKVIASDEAIWVGTESGALKYDRKRRFWRVFTSEDGLADNAVRSILLDGDHIWFGTRGGLTRFYWNNPYRID